jgi:hypothetical protein
MSTDDLSAFGKVCGNDSKEKSHCSSAYSQQSDKRTTFCLKDAPQFLNEHAA